MDAQEKGELNLLTHTEIKELMGGDKLSAVGALTKGSQEIQWLHTDYFLPLFGLSPKLGPIADWNLEIEKKCH